MISIKVPRTMDGLSGMGAPRKRKAKPVYQDGIEEMFAQNQDASYTLLSDGCEPPAKRRRGRVVSCQQDKFATILTDQSVLRDKFFVDVMGRSCIAGLCSSPAKRQYRRKAPRQKHGLSNLGPEPTHVPVHVAPVVKTRFGRVLAENEIAAFVTLDIAYYAPWADINCRYKALMKKFHPDRAKGNNERCAIINDAFDTLRAICEPGPEPSDCP